MEGSVNLELICKILIPVTFLLILTGCNDSSETNKVTQEVENEVSAEAANEVSEEITNEEKNNNTPIELKDVLSFNKNEIINLLGQPQDELIGEGNTYLDYDGLSITLNFSQKVTRLEVKSDKYLFSGIMLGSKPDDVRQKLGKATSEGISESGESFELVYDTVINGNQTNRMYFASSNFSSPIDYISYSEIDTTPLFTTEEVKKMLIGSWVREEDMMNGDYSDLVYFTETKMITNSYNGTIQGLASLYNVINYDTIEMTGINSYSDYEYEKFEKYTLEVSPDGESITIYRADSYTGEIFENSVINLYKYSDSIVTQ